MKTVLITGASSGLGEAIARQLLSESGYTVYVAARRVEKMRELEALGAIALAMDITDEADVRRVVATIEAQTGGVDMLVNNAGFGLYGPVEEVSLEAARYQFEVNLFGLAQLTKLVVPHMREKGAGRIVNISSMGGKIYTPLGAWYHATKHALEGWSDCLRLELKPFGIDVIVVEPGVIQTAFGDVIEETTEASVEAGDAGAYGDLKARVAAKTRESYEAGAASPPELIGRVVSRALRAKRPRTRYVAGKHARTLLWIRRWLGDRIYDAIVMMQY